MRARAALDARVGDVPVRADGQYGFRPGQDLASRIRHAHGRAQPDRPGGLRSGDACAGGAGVRRKTMGWAESQRWRTAGAETRGRPACSCGESVRNTIHLGRPDTTNSCVSGFTAFCVGYPSRTPVRGRPFSALGQQPQQRAAPTHRRRQARSQCGVARRHLNLRALSGNARLTIGSCAHLNRAFRPACVDPKVAEPILQHLPSLAASALWRGGSRRAKRAVAPPIEIQMRSNKTYTPLRDRGQRSAAKKCEPNRRPMEVVRTAHASSPGKT